MTLLAVVADLHIDDFGSRVDPATGLSVRFTDGLRVLRWIAQDAHERGCEAMVLAGDFTETGHPGSGRATRIAEALADFPGPFVLDRGNHDHAKDGRTIVDTLVRMLPEASGFSDKPGIQWVRGTAICVIPYMDRRWARVQPGMETAPDAEVYAWLADTFVSIASGLWAAAQDGDPDRVVLVVHQALAGGRMNEQRQAFLGGESLVVDTRRLGAIGFDAILAGHFHLHDAYDLGSLVVSVGSPQCTDFGEEHQTKGYVVLDTDRRSIEHVATPASRFVTLRGDPAHEAANVAGAVVRGVDLDPAVDLSQLRRALEEEGALQVTTLAHAPADVVSVSEAFGEDLSPAAALRSYFAGAVDGDELTALGTAVLAEVTDDDRNDP